MGSSLSVCGLGPSAGERRLHQSSSSQSQSRHHTFEREKVMELLSHADRARSLSITTDESVASILSSSDRLIPDAFMPVDIQVVSQRRVRPTSSRFLALATASHSGGAKSAASTSSHYYNTGAHANAAFLRYLTSSTSSESVPPSASERFASRRKGGLGDSGELPPPHAVHPRLQLADDDGAGASSRRSGSLSVKGAA